MNVLGNKVGYWDVQVDLRAHLYPDFPCPWFGLAAIEEGKAAHEMLPPWCSSELCSSVCCQELISAGVVLDGKLSQLWIFLVPQLMHLKYRKWWVPLNPLDVTSWYVVQSCVQNFSLAFFPDLSPKLWGKFFDGKPGYEAIPHPQ